MSRSRAYRSMHLSAEDLAEIARQCRAERSDALLTPLRAHLDRSLAALAPEVVHRHSDRLATRIADANDIAHLRSLAIELGDLATPLPATEPRLGVSPGATLQRQRPDSAMTGGSLPASGLLIPHAVPKTDHHPATTAFDIARLRLEIEQLEAHAAQLGLPLPDLPRLLDQVDAAERSAAANLTSAARHILDEVAVGISVADETFVVALVDAEVRSESVETATEVLVDMGYRVDAPTFTANATTVTARASDGSAATVTVTSRDDGGVSLSSEFTDPGTAVPASHPLANELCERAVADQMLFTTSVAAGRFNVDSTHTDERPTRSSLSAATSAQGRRRNTTNRRNNRRMKGPKR